jgi:hypothetical protein
VTKPLELSVSSCCTHGQSANKTRTFWHQIHHNEWTERNGTNERYLITTVFSLNFAKKLYLQFCFWNFLCWADHKGSTNTPSVSYPLQVLTNEKRKSWHDLWIFSSVYKLVSLYSVTWLVTFWFLMTP